MKNNYANETNEGTYVKVIDFPPGEDSDLSGESMWVLKTNGTINDGYGVLMNSPMFAKDTKFGDVIQYGEGTSMLKPKYLKNVSKEYQKSVE